MDISKYIGLYLVKNGYCSLPGLGTLQIQKTSAKKNTSGEIIAPTTKILFNNVGSIDDQFPHFIGLRENISSNNASNAINNFSAEVKETINSNHPFIIEGVGRFVAKEGKISFIEVPDFNMADFDLTIPAHNDIPFSNENSRVPNPNAVAESSFSAVSGSTIKQERSLNYGRLALAIGTLAALAGVIYLGYNYLRQNQEAAKAQNLTQDTVATTATTVDTAITPIDTTAIVRTDTTTTNKDTTTKTLATDTNKTFVGPALKVVVRTYNTQASADAYGAKLTSYGKTTLVNKLDSITYQVIVNLPSTSKPADQVVNELRANYNPGEKFGKVSIAK